MEEAWEVVRRGLGLGSLSREILPLASIGLPLGAVIQRNDLDDANFQTSTACRDHVRRRDDMGMLGIRQSHRIRPAYLAQASG